MTTATTAVTSARELKLSSVHVEAFTKHNRKQKISIQYESTDQESQEDFINITKTRSQGSKSTIVENFDSDHIARLAGVLHRHQGANPRRLLWRVVGPYELNIESVDLTSSGGHSTQYCTLVFRFPEIICNRCVAALDNPASDKALFYVLDETYNFFILHLDTQSFTSFLSQARQSDWCTRLRPPTLSLVPPYSMKIVDPTTAIFALENGALLITSFPGFSHLSEKLSNDGSYLSSLKGILPTWPKLKTSYPSDLIVSTVASTIHNLIITVSLDRRIKIWSLETGTLLKIHSTAIGSVNMPFDTPENNNLISFIEECDPGPHLFYMITIDPTGDGVFKLWAGEHNGHGAFTDIVELDSMQGKPPQSQSFWSVIDFAIYPHISGTVTSRPSKQIELWVLWKSNTRFVLQMLRLKPKKLFPSEPQWVIVHPPGNLVSSNLSRVRSFTVDTDATAVWLERIFSPGRFSTAAIISALNAYTSETRHFDMTNQKTVPLAIQVREAVVGQVTLKKPNSGEVESTVYRKDLGSEFSRFDRICTEFDRRGQEALCLSMDRKSDIVFVVQADRLALLRACIDVESCHLPLAVQSVMNIARSLRDNLPVHLVTEYHLALDEESKQIPRLSIDDRLWSLLNRCSIGNVDTQIIDEIKQKIKSFDNTENTMQQALEYISRHSEGKIDAMASHAGAEFIFDAIHEICMLTYVYLQDYVLLLCLFSQDEADPVLNFHKLAVLYGSAVSSLGIYESLNLLARQTVTSMPQVDALTINLSKIQMIDQNVDTIRKNAPLLSVLISSNAGVSLIQGTLFGITESIAGLLSKLSDPNRELILSLGVLLLIRGYVQEASEITSYFPSSSLGSYVRARILLAASQPEKSEPIFMRCAPYIALSHIKAPSEVLALFKDGENPIAGGLFKYYLHISSLLFHAKAFSQAYRAANTAQNHIDDDTLPDDVMVTLDIGFRSALTAGLMEEAYVNRRKKSLQQFVPAMCEQGFAQRLCELPFVGMVDDVDGVLRNKTRQMLDVRAQPRYHKLLYAWRLKHGDYRGAASILYQRLQWLKNAIKSHPQTMYGELEIAEDYLIVINALSCATPEHSWIIASSLVESQDRLAKRPKTEHPSIGLIVDDNGTHKSTLNIQSLTAKAGNKMVRKVLTIDEIRKEYQAEILKMASILNHSIDKSVLYENA